MTNQRLAYLYEKYKQKTCTYPELEEWFLLLQSPEARAQVEQWTETDWKQAKEVAAEAGEMDWDFMFGNIVQPETPQTQVYAMRPKAPLFALRKMAAAAVLVLLAGAVAVLLLNRKDAGQEMAKTRDVQKKQSGIVPGREGAILTLADGRHIVLDSIGNGALAKEGSTEIRKENGQLVYNNRDTAGAAAYNTMTTPRGRQYQLTLADGSRVWLNAASSVTFPTAFVGSERRVEISGEAYFEVAHDASKPFVVAVAGMEVKVLGTHFNINSYSDEPSIKTTLLEGRVMVERGGRQVYLNPGQQAILRPGQDNIRVAYDVDVDEVVAWKNGSFSYNRVDIETIMRQVARWYDVEVVYEKKTDETFSGGLPRSQNVSELLKRLEATERVNFEIKGKLIIVKEK